MTMVKYEISKYITEEREININDTHNCFLCGTDEVYGRKSYLGIYSGTDKRLHAVVISGGCIAVNESTESHGIYTESYIRDFCKRNKNICEIERKTFEDKLKQSIERLGLNLL